MHENNRGKFKCVVGGGSDHYRASRSAEIMCTLIDKLALLVGQAAKYLPTDLTFWT